MRNFLHLSMLALILPLSAAAQNAKEVEVILPLEAQTCNLPVAPARIPEEANLDQLSVAKKNVVGFQAEMTSYRECLDAASQSASISDGNREALTKAHNYSVEMEERIAEQFNIAVRAYKERQAEK